MTVLLREIAAATTSASAWAGALAVAALILAGTALA